MLYIPRRRLLLGAGAFASYAALSKEAAPFWQSRDSNYNQSVGGAAPSAMSLVLVSASSQFLSKTWGAASTDGTKTTIAFFIKFTIVPGGNNYIYDGGSIAPGSNTQFNGFSGGLITTRYSPDGVATDDFTGGPVNDTTTWHHVCMQFDSTQATATNRTHIYLDGVEVTYGTQIAPAQNTDWKLAASAVQSFIGKIFFGSAAIDAKLAYFYLIDGQALTPSSFTTGTGAGTTHPAAYGGTFGTNGFFLNFTGSNTNDQSGNTNNWTQNGSPTFSSDVPT